MLMTDICLCDDNSEVLRHYSMLISEIAAKENIPINISTFSSGEQLMFIDEINLCQFDIIYLDMLMGKLSGIETARALRNIGFSGEIIFLTSSRDHTLEAFDVTPLHYIVKQEVSDAKFAEVFLKAVKLTDNKEKESFAFEAKGILTRIPLDDILYFEVRIRQIYIHTQENVYSFYSKIDTVEKQLATKGFERCHRSFVVNLKAIRSMSAQQIILSHGDAIPVGSKYLNSLRRQFSQYLEGHSVIL